MAILSVIRRWHFREGMPIREITRRTGLGRNTVRKYLADGVVEPRYAGRKSPSKLDGYEQTLTHWLFCEASRHRKQRKAIKQLHGDLVQLGFTGSYDRVAAFARVWREKRQEAKQAAARHAYVPLSFAPGEAFQFDWSEDYAVIGGTNTKLQIAHFKLSHSRAFFLRAYLTQAHEMLFDAHYHAFQAFGGVPGRGLYDNMKTAVDKVGRGKQRGVNKRFTAMVSHYLYEAEFCNPASGWEKGQIEKNVLGSRRRIWQGAPAFKSLVALNAWLKRRCLELWRELPHPEDKRRTVYDVWAAEREQLMAAPAAFDGFVEVNKRVSSTCLISHEHNRYSVPASFANRPVSLRIYPDRLVVVAEAQVIASHERVFNRGRKANSGKTVYDWRHYLPVVQRKPGALRNGAPFNTLPDSFRQLQNKLLKHPGGDREMADILALVLLYDEVLVEQAVAQALHAGQPSKRHVPNCLSRLVEPMKPKLSATPPTLKLVTEPLADTGRYDRLRGVRL